MRTDYTEIEKSVIFEISDVDGLFYTLIQMVESKRYFIKRHFNCKVSTVHFTKDRANAFEMFNAKITEASKIATAIIPW